MAKISTYGIVPSPASLTDLLIGTDVNSNNVTKNFEIGQILSLYSKGFYTSLTDQYADNINVPVAIEFAETILENGVTFTIPNLFTIENSGDYLLNLDLQLEAVGVSIFRVLLQINGILVPFGSLLTTTAGYNTISVSAAANLAVGDTIQWFFQTNIITTFLSAYLTEGEGEFPSAKFSLTQI